MSHFAKLSTQFEDEHVLKSALMDLLLTGEGKDIVVEDFQSGKVDDGRNTFDCDFYLKRELLGTSFCDLGFAKNDSGIFDMVVDDGYDYVKVRHLDNKIKIKEFQARLNATYAKETFTSHGDLEGLLEDAIQIVDPDGTIRICVPQTAGAL